MTDRKFDQTEGNDTLRQETARKDEMPGHCRGLSTSSTDELDDIESDNELAPQAELTREQLRNLLITFLNGLASSPPPGSTSESNPPLTENPADVLAASIESGEKASNTPATADSSNTRATILNGVQFVETKGEGPISWLIPEFGKTKRDRTQ